MNRHPSNVSSAALCCFSLRRLGRSHSEYRVLPKTEWRLTEYLEKMKSTFTRTNSTSGRRSRTNSIRERRDHTDSSISRESGASLTSSKTDKGDPTTSPAQQPAQQLLMQSPSASASILSLASHAQRGGASPIPPASTADLAKYQDAKLFPFPGMIQLEEKRNRARGLPSASASSPDIVTMTGDEELTFSSPNSPGHTPEMTRERKLSHQARILTSLPSTVLLALRLHNPTISVLRPNLLLRMVAL